MLALRYAGVVALTLWVGGAVALGAVAAPSIFDVLAARHVADDRVVAGAVFGETSRRFHLLSYACAVALFGSLLSRAVLGPRPRRFAVRLAVALLMLLAVGYSGFVLSEQIARASAEIGVAVSTLPEQDPRRIAFGRLHAWSLGVWLVPIAGGLCLLFMELKDPA